MRTYNDKCRQINNNIYLIVRFLWWAKISSFLHICCCRWKHSSSLQNSQWFLCYLTVLISISGWHETDGGQDMILLQENKTKKKLWNQECFGLPVDYFHFSAFLLLHFRIFFFNPHLSDSCYKLKFRISREAHKKNHSGVKNQKYKCYLKREHSFCVWRKRDSLSIFLVALHLQTNQRWQREYWRCQRVIFTYQTKVCAFLNVSISKVKVCCSICKS